MSKVASFGFYWIALKVPQPTGIKGQQTDGDFMQQQNTKCLCFSVVLLSFAGMARLLIHQINRSFSFHPTCLALQTICVLTVWLFIFGLISMHFPPPQKTPLNKAKTKRSSSDVLEKTNQSSNGWNNLDVCAFEEK